MFFSGGEIQSNYLDRYLKPILNGIPKLKTKTDLIIYLLRPKPEGIIKKSEQIRMFIKILLKTQSRYLKININISRMCLVPFYPQDQVTPGMQDSQNSLMDSYIHILFDFQLTFSCLNCHLFFYPSSDSISNPSLRKFFCMPLQLSSLTSWK